MRKMYTLLCGLNQISYAALFSSPAMLDRNSTESLTIGVGEELLRCFIFSLKLLLQNSKIDNLLKHDPDPSALLYQREFLSQWEQSRFSNLTLLTERCQLLDFDD